MSRRAYLALGSNLGDRRGHLQGAVDGLGRVRGVEVVALSRVYETDPVGPSQPDYLNAVVAIDTDLGPRGLLGLAHRLEDEAGRVRAQRWGPRSLDVDVLWVDGCVVAQADLVVPHPRLWERGFVLAPLHDVAPDLVDGHGGRPAAGWEGVRATAVALEMPPRS